MKEILLATIPATIPTLAVLVGILLNQARLGRLEARINSLETRLDGRIDTLAGEIIALRQQLHNDVVMLVGRDADKSERLACLEERSKN